MITETEKKPMIVLTGPTAVGKTDLSIGLAKAVNGAIISADSMQVYKYMDIGSAKIMPEEMAGVRHYLVDCLLPSEEFNIVRFQTMAKEALKEIYAAGQIPIITGGTGFYIQGLLYDIDFTEQKEDTSFRKEMEEYARAEGAEALHSRLREVDPASADAIHANNVKRVIRALEYYRQTGSPISAHNEAERQKESPYNFLYLVLNDDRQKLYARIEERVDWMMEKGLLSEVERLKDMGYHRSMVSMQGLGYKELLDYLDGKCTLEEAVAEIKLQTRHFAKRQLTWFRRENEVVWLNKGDFNYDESRILTFIEDLMKERGMIN